MNKALFPPIPLYLKHEEQEGLRQAAHLAAKTLDFITDKVQAGVSTADLDHLCEQFIRSHGATPAPLNYRGYPKATCISLNEVICHGIPSTKRLLKPRDILNIDIAVVLNGWFGDTSRMFIVDSAPTPRALDLIKATYECLMLSIDAVKPGAHIGDIGNTIQNYIRPKGFSIVTDFCGHGLGREFHTPPEVLHKGKLNTGPEILPGMCFTIEPMINLGTSRSKILADGWTAITADKKLSAQFEHQLLVTETGCDILTLSPANLHHPSF